MLPAANRIRTSAEFTKVFRNGKKSGNQLLAVYAIQRRQNTQADLPQVGFVVGKKVGNSVVRHRVIRKMREIMRQMLPELAANEIVIRAFPAAACANSAQLEAAIRKSLKKIGIL